MSHHHVSLMISPTRAMDGLPVQDGNQDGNPQDRPAWARADMDVGAEPFRSAAKPAPPLTNGEIEHGSGPSAESADNPPAVRARSATQAIVAHDAGQDSRCAPESLSGAETHQPSLREIGGVPSAGDVVSAPETQIEKLWGPGPVAPAAGGTGTGTVTLTEWQRTVALEREELMLRWDALRAAYSERDERLSLRQAARLLGKSPATLTRTRRIWQGDFASAVPARKPGRPRRWDHVAAVPEVRAKLQELYFLSCGASSDYMTKGRRTGSAASTLKIFAREPLCAQWPDLALELSMGVQPIALVREIRKINDLHEQRQRGPKHTSLNANLTARRSLIEILQDGTQQHIAMGDWWVFDDMSDNLPHWWTGPGNEPLLGRQGLYCYDLVKRWMAVEKVGTVRDSYTAAIILRFIRRLMEAFGKPRRGVVFERSVWQARTITGVRITREGQMVDEAVERPSMGDEEMSMLQAGLRAAGFMVHYTHTPRGKEIEGAFNHLQRLKPMVASQWMARRRRGHADASGGRGHSPRTPQLGNGNENEKAAGQGPQVLAGSGAAPQFGRQPVNIGRHAGEFERAAKQLRRVRAGSHHPADLGFLHIEDSLDIDLETFEIINGPTIPYPALAPLTEQDRAVFLPEKRPLQIRDGRVTATVDGQPLDFSAPELFASLGNGYRLVVAFDASEPTLGAALYNAETSTSNHQGWRVGEYIGHAGFLDTVTRFDWREDGDQSQSDVRRRYNKAVRTAFGAVGLSQVRVRSSEARDGRGSVATINPQAAAAGAGARPTVAVSSSRLGPAIEEQRRLEAIATAALERCSE